MAFAITLRSFGRRPGRAPGRGRGTVLVTGASTGIGAATVQALADEGFHVLAGVRSLADGVSVKGLRDDIEPILLDITDPAHVDAFVERIDREPGGLTALVNNAGILSVGPIELIPQERWETVVDVNILGTVRITRAALPALLRARGRVINVSSPSGMIALPMFGPYAVSKFALEGFNDTLRLEVEPHGVRVVCVTPGLISTPIFDKGVAEGQHIMDRHPSAELHARYGPMASSAIKAGTETKTGGRSPEEAAAVIVHAITARRPKQRYLMGIENRVVWVLARVVPARLSDRILRYAASDGDYVYDAAAAHAAAERLAVPSSDA